MMQSLEIIDALIEKGFSAVKLNDKGGLFSHKNIKHPLYVKVQNGKAVKEPLVIHSDYYDIAIDAEDRDTGIYANYTKPYHSTAMSGFDKRVNRGKNEIYYGYAVDLFDKTSLDDLLVQLT